MGQSGGSGLLVKSLGSLEFRNSAGTNGMLGDSNELGEELDASRSR